MRGILLTGLPGVGKSTTCRKVTELCRERGYRVEGFITEELRERRTRVGFDLVELGEGPGAGRRAPLARVGDDNPRVGKYTVALEEFESLAIPVLDRISGVRNGDRVVCIIDEIGKMELFSKDFVSRTRRLLAQRPVPMLFTIALHGSGFIAEAKRVPGLELIEITPATRKSAPGDILERLLGSAGASGRTDSLSGGVGASSSASVPTEGVGNGRPVGSKLTRRWQARSTDKDQGKVETGMSQNHNHAAVASGQVVLWFRNDLRLADNPLIERCLALSNQHGGAPIVPVCCLDPRSFAGDAHTSFGSPKCGSFRRRFLQETLDDLKASLESRGSSLVVLDAAPEDVLPLLAGQGGIVLASQETCTEELAAESRVRAAVQEKGARLELLDAGGVTSMFGSADLAAAGLRLGAAFPEDFRVFYGAVKPSVSTVCQQALHGAPEVMPPLGTVPQELEESTVTGPYASEPVNAHEAAGPPIRGGETEALIRLRTWLKDGGLRSYKSTFRHLLGDYSSRLSAHLALGCVSPRRVCSEACRALQSGPHVEHFVYELCWRDFFRHAARRWGASLFQLQGPMRSAASSTWRRCADTEDRWRQGLTGVPLLDAVMRELRKSGYIGNLARQMAAAFLVEDLGVDWRVGADWFEALLVDYDPHSNWGQWTRSAGVAPTNEAKRQRVGGTRYYDIALQHDSDQAVRYIHAWIPELAEVEGTAVLAPWQSGRVPRGYPQSPICSPALRKYFEDAAAGVHIGKGQGGRGGRGGKGRGGKWHR